MIGIWTRRSRWHSEGFTLIELLFVISIVSLLIALLLPAIGRARNAAKTVYCMDLQRQTGISYHAYAADNKGFILVNYKQDSRWRNVQSRIRRPYEEGYTDLPHARSPADSQASNPAGNTVYCPAYEAIQDNATPFSWLSAEDTRKPRWSTTAGVPTSGGDPNRPLNGNKWIFSYTQNTSFGDREFLFTDSDNRNHYDVFPTARFDDLRRPSNMLLVAETWIDWGAQWGLTNGLSAIYFNPNHAFETPVLLADGHVSRYNKDNVDTLDAADPTQ